MTNKQRRMVKRDFGVKVPSDIPARILLNEDESECIIHVFPLAGEKPWEPYGAKKSEPGERDNHGRETMMYYFDRITDPKEKRKE